jgi:DNA topoisomerase IB
MSNSKLEIKRVDINPKTKKKRFIYLDKKNNQIKDAETLTRLKKLNVPPAYTNVKIAATSNNYLQAIGIDDKGRQQYIYNKTFIDNQSRNKYCALKNFGQNITKIRQDVRNVLLNDKPVTTKEKIIALVIYILDNCKFRIGNIHYFNEHESHGVSTLQAKHLSFKSNNELNIEFIGKKGVNNQCILKDSVSIKLIKELSELTKKKKFSNSFLFNYLDENNNSQLIKPTDINNFLSEYHPDITLKMFRTWGANYIFLEEMIKNKNEFMNIFKIHSLNNNNNSKLIEDISISNNEKIRKKINRESDKIIKEIIKIIANKLHNTPTVSKKSYLDNNLVIIYLQNPKAFWKRIKDSKNINDLNIILVELLNQNCNKTKCKNKNCSNSNSNNSIIVE